MHKGISSIVTRTGAVWSSYNEQQLAGQYVNILGIRWDAAHILAAQVTANPGVEFTLGVGDVVMRSTSHIKEIPEWGCVVRYKDKICLVSYVNEGNTPRHCEPSDVGSA